MPINNSKCTEEIRERTVRHIIESGKSASSVAAEMGINTKTVCRRVRDRRKHHLPSNAEDKGIKQATTKIEKEASRQLKARDKWIRELEEEEDILKKSLRIFMRHCDEV